MNKTLKTSLLVFSIMAVFTNCKEENKDFPVQKNSVYTELHQQSDLSITLQAIEMAGLQQTLSQDNLTFFAPTDSAFTSYLMDLGVDSLSGLYNLYGHNTFKQVMLYHLLEKKVKTMDVVNSYIITAASNASGNKMHAYITSVYKNISLNAFDASVCESDIEVEGSIIHKINGVLTPLSLNGLIRVNQNFGKLKSAISKTQDNLETLLNGENQVHTFFAPDDVAINSFLARKGFSTWSDYIYANDSYSLSNLLKYHIINGEVQAQALQNQSYGTLYTNHLLEIFKEQSGSINVKDEKGSNPSAVVKTTDITALNGTLHIIDKVLEHN